MNYQEVETYLSKFDQILYTMSNKMFKKKNTCSITLDFIESMIPHHEAAIFMCENLLCYTRNQRLRNLANNIIRTQTKGIEQMTEIYKTTSFLYNNQIDFCCYFEQYLRITEQMIYQMSEAPKCGNIDLDFINEMIPHHEGAISMCENLLKYLIDPRLQVVAQNIIQEQSKGVKELYDIKMQICHSNL